MIELIAAGFLIGFMGSLHCVGMCGPLAVLLHANAPGNQVVNGLLYNAGRIITYTLLGVIIALIGKTFIAAGFQQVVSIISGCIILLILFLPIALKRKIPGTQILESFVGRMKKAWSGILKQHTKTSVLAGGIINGFLPCGLVYVALVAALNAHSIGGGALFMTMFGLGTVPAMFIAGTVGNFFSMPLRMRIRKIIPVFTFLVAVILILRGLGLGIPYVSPHLDASGHVMECCKNPNVK